MDLYKFSNGEKIYKKITEKYGYIRHKKGKVIVAPMAAGKSFYIENQREKEWIDGETLADELGVDWRQLTYESNKAVDFVLFQSKQYGYKIMTSVLGDYVPDAYVIIPLKTHKKYIAKRKDLTLEKAMKVRNWMKARAKKYNVPVYSSLEEAIEKLK